MKRRNRRPNISSTAAFCDARLKLTAPQKAARHARIVAAMPDPNISQAAKLTRARLMAGR